MFRGQSDDPFAVFVYSISIQIFLLFLHISRGIQLLPAPGGVVIHSDFPFLTAGNGTGSGDAGKMFIVIRT